MRRSIDADDTRDSAEAAELRALLDLVESLSWPAPVADVAAKIARAATEIGAARVGVVGIRRASGLVATAVRPESADADTQRLIDGPMTEAMVHGRTVFLPDLDAWRSRYPATPPPSGRGWLAVAVPADGGPVIVVGLGFDDPPDPTVMRTIEVTIYHGGLALERAVAADRERGIAQSLQAGLAPDRIPEIPDLDVAAAYTAGGEGRLGGDWYDVFVLPSGLAALVIGDVASSGVENAADMARLRHTVHAFLYDHGDPSRAIAQTRDVLDAIEDDVFATVLIVVIDTESATAWISRAGHIPPLLVDGGAARFVTGGASPPIGAPWSHPPENTTVELPAGSTIVMVTDGVVEDRRSDIDRGLHRLRTATIDATGDAKSLAAGLMSLPGSEDDRTVLVARTMANGLEAAD